MNEYPLRHFLQSSTFRNMIALQMPQQASGIMRSKNKFIGNEKSLSHQESRSRPNLERYHLRPSIYEK